MTSMHMCKYGEWNEDEGDLQGFSSQEEGPKLIQFESPRWRPKTTEVRVHLGVQEPEGDPTERLNLDDYNSDDFDEYLSENMETTPPTIMH